MGAHVESIYQISSDGGWEIYAYVFFIQPYEEAYNYLEGSFTRICCALGSKGLIIMGDGYNDIITREIYDKFGDLDNIVKSILYNSTKGYTPGILVTNINPHQTKKVNDPHIVFIPLKNSKIDEVVTDIIKTARDGNWDRLWMRDVLSKDSSKYIESFNNIIRLKPSIFGFGIDLNALLTNIYDVQKKRRARLRHPPRNRKY